MIKLFQSWLWHVYIHWYPESCPLLVGILCSTDYIEIKLLLCVFINQSVEELHIYINSEILLQGSILSGKSWMKKKGKMAQQSRPDDLSLVPGTQMDRLQRAALLSTIAPWHTCPHTYTMNMWDGIFRKESGWCMWSKCNTKYSNSG